MIGGLPCQMLHRPSHRENRRQRHRQTPLSQSDQHPPPSIAPAGRGGGGEGHKAAANVIDDSPLPARPTDSTYSGDKRQILWKSVVIKLMVEFFTAKKQRCEEAKKREFPLLLCFFASLPLCSKNRHFTLILTSTDFVEIT